MCALSFMYIICLQYNFLSSGNPGIQIKRMCLLWNLMCVVVYPCFFYATSHYTHFVVGYCK